MTNMHLQLTRTKAVLVTFVILGVAPFAYAATRASFWEHEHSMAPVATALYLLILGALVLGRYRWAWVLLALVYGGAIVTWGFDPPRTPSDALNLVANVATLAILLSSPIRDRLRRPVSIRGRSPHFSQG